MTIPEFFPEPRQRVELQYAHDLLSAVLLNHELADQVVEQGMRPALIAARDCLCWCLQHENISFPQMLNKLRLRMEAIGAVMLPLPQTGDKTE